MIAATKLVQSSACSIDADMYVNREVLSLKLVPATMFSELHEKHFSYEPQAPHLNLFVPKSDQA